MKQILKIASLTFCLSLCFIRIVAAENIREIGLSLPLSGDLAPLGTAVSNGIKLAVEQHADLFDQLRFIYDDNRYDAKAALGFFEKFKSKPDMQLLYVWGSPTCMAVAALAERSRRALVCFSGDPKVGLQYVVSFNNPAADYAAATAVHLRTMASKPVSIVYSEIPFYTALADELEKQLSSPNSLIHRESVLPDTRDFNTLALKLRGLPAHSLVLFLLPAQIPIFARQMAALDYHPEVVGTDTFSDHEAIKASKGVLDRAVYFDMIVDADFEAAYSTKYGDTSNITFAYNGYRFALTLGDLLGREKAPISQDLMVERLRNYHAPATNKLAPISFKTDEKFGQYFSFPIELKRVEPGA